MSARSKLDTTSHSGGKKMVSRRVRALVLVFFMRTQCPNKDRELRKMCFGQFNI